MVSLPFPPAPVVVALAHIPAHILSNDGHPIGLVPALLPKRPTAVKNRGCVERVEPQAVGSSRFEDDAQFPGPGWRKKRGTVGEERRMGMG
ncbi:hypothetical protein MKZ38_007980 [Zalerion maritima]|uniref:Uncharacterized protein n=1 Tax=Zalerion maritima TaxID=339359 RepID=A0AAD5RHY9_9PEZI|nr:hypothetical protein MKZ38_007980 [Zalerion maritima]